MNAYKKVMDGVTVVEKAVLILVSIIVTVITFANVVVRKTTNSSFAFTEELVINLFILMIMLGCALCAREGNLISLSLIFDRMHKNVKKVMVVITTVFNSIFWILLIKTGIDKVLTQMANGSQTFSLRWPEWWFTIFLPIGGVFLLLHTIEFCMDVLSERAECIKMDDEGENG